MATRADYRNELSDKLVGLEDSGYGDFDYTEDELNTYLSLATARLFPACYKRVKLADQAVTAYGTRGLGLVELPASIPAERVYLVETTDERESLVGWMPRGQELVAIPMDRDSVTVNIHYFTACEFPADDVTEVEVPDEFRPLLVLGAFVEALEARRDTNTRPAIDSNPDASGALLDRLNGRFQEMKAEMAMALPARTF